MTFIISVIVILIINVNIWVVLKKVLSECDHKEMRSEKMNMSPSLLQNTQVEAPGPWLPGPSPVVCCGVTLTTSGASTTERTKPGSVRHYSVNAPTSGADEKLMQYTQLYTKLH